MIDKNLIQNQIEEELNRKIKFEDTSLMILTNQTIETPEYLIFFYNTKRFIETGDFSYNLAGNAPIIVNKGTGERYITGTAHPIDYYTHRYEKGLLDVWR